MRISGLGVIEDAVLELAPGLTVVTGETGAGKTMVVTGLGLLFGGRADPGAVRPGAATASVEGRLRVEPDGAVAARATDAGAELDDDVLLVARTVSADRPVPGLPGRPGGAGRGRWPSWPSPAWRCTARATSRGCCSRPASARRWTATPERRSPTPSRPTDRRTTRSERSAPSSPS